MKSDTAIDRTTYLVEGVLKPVFFWLVLMAALVLLGKLVKSLEHDAAVRAAGTLYFYLYAAPAHLIAARNRLGDLCASHLFLLPAAIFLLFSIQWTEFGRNNAQITDGFRTGGNIAQDVLSGYFLIFTGILLVRKARPPVASAGERSNQSTFKESGSSRSFTTEQGTLSKEACYERLGLGKDPAGEEIKAAYRSLLMKYHPDKVEHLGPEFKAIARKRTLEIIEAYESLARTHRLD